MPHYDTQIKLFLKSKAEMKARVAADSRPPPDRPFSPGSLRLFIYFLYFTKCLTIYLKSERLIIIVSFNSVCLLFLEAILFPFA